MVVAEEVPPPPPPPPLPDAGPGFARFRIKLPFWIHIRVVKPEGDTVREREFIWSTRSRWQRYFTRRDHTKYSHYTVGPFIASFRSD